MWTWCTKVKVKGLVTRLKQTCRENRAGWRRHHIVPLVSHNAAFTAASCVFWATWGWSWATWGWSASTEKDVAAGRCVCSQTRRELNSPSGLWSLRAVSISQRRTGKSLFSRRDAEPHIRHQYQLLEDTVRRVRVGRARKHSASQATSVSVAEATSGAAEVLWLCVQLLWWNVSASHLL